MIAHYMRKKNRMKLTICERSQSLFCDFILFCFILVRKVSSTCVELNVIRIENHSFDNIALLLQNFILLVLFYYCNYKIKEEIKENLIFKYEVKIKKNI